MSAFQVFGKVLKPLLLPFSILYGGVMLVRNYFYNKNWYSSVQFSIPVISVGNLSTGGTGKTPHIEYLIRLLEYQYKVATMSRGYKRKTQGFRIAKPGTDATEIGDEPYQFFRKFPELTVCVSENRMIGIPELLTHRPHLDLILLDDAFQHRSVKPGINILITDYNKPFYKDYILPLGSLREARSSYKRADIIIVSKCPADLASDLQSEIKNAIAPQAHQSIYFSTVQYGVPYDILSRNPVQLAADTEIISVAGIANPTPLVQHLETQFQSVHLLDYPDHHFYSYSDLDEIVEVYKNATAGKTVIITTEKDASRWELFEKEIKEHNLPFYVLPIEIALLNGDASRFSQQIIDYIEQEKAAMQEYGSNF